MDRDVISIGFSSSENTRCGASDNESFSLEKLKVSRLIGEGTSPLCGRARPSSASPAKEPVPVTVILSPSAFGGARRRGRDIRASPRMQRSYSAWSLLSTPAIAGCEWVRDDVLKYKSSLTSAVSVTSNLEDSCKIAVQACRSDDFPFYRATLGSPPFFFIYRCLVEILGLVPP
ncbi:hypothetical protein HKD37_07G020084 [Glycine soja]